MAVVWMKVTLDRLQLPIAVADTAKELAEMLGMVSANSIYSSLSRAEAKRREGRPAQSRYVTVEVEDDVEDRR